VLYVFLCVEICVSRREEIGRFLTCLGTAEEMSRSVAIARLVGRSSRRSSAALVASSSPPLSSSIDAGEVWCNRRVLHSRAFTSDQQAAAAKWTQVLFLFLLSSSSSSSCHCSYFRIFFFCFKMRFLARLLAWQHVLPTSLAACLQQGFCGSILTPRHVLRGLHTAIFRSRDMESLGHGFLSILCKFKHFSCVLLYEGENRRLRLLQAVVQQQEEESNLLHQLRQQQNHSQQLQQRWCMLLLVKGFRLLQLLQNPLFTK
jgi:hypothetical protein